MNTRLKILTLDQAMALPPKAHTLVSGYFDGLRAAHIPELAGLPRPIVAVVLPLAGELVPQPARAEMAAALRMIDYVVIAQESEVDALVQHLNPPAIARLEERDAILAKQLIDHVRHRQNC